MRNNPDFLPSITNNWSTPTDLYNAFIEKGYKDPCPLCADFNGLNIDYYNDKLYINPPFNDLSIWVDYAIRQVNNGCIVYILMPARTDTQYFKKLCLMQPFIYFFVGRLKFGNSSKPAPFPTIIVRIGSSSSFNTFGYGSVDNFIKKFIFNL